MTQGTPRTRFLLVSCTAACIACAVGSLSSPLLVLPVAVTSGLAFGACWALLPALAADLFGLAHLASNYCLVQLAPALGSIGFATLLAGQLYQAYGRVHGDPAGTCVGPACYGVALMVASGACGVGLGAAVVLDRSARALYVQEHEELHAWDATTDD